MADRRGGDPPADPHGYDAVIVFGGAMNVDEEDEHPWLADRSPAAGAAGARRPAARRLPRRPAAGRGGGGGAAPGAAAGDRLAPGRADRRRPRGPAARRRFPTAFNAFQWHSYEMGIDDGEVLARSEVCAQAARFGPLAWAIQFHAEVSERDALTWIADYESDPDAVAIGLDPEALARRDPRARSAPGTRSGAPSAPASSSSPPPESSRASGRLSRDARETKLPQRWTATRG